MKNNENWVSDIIVTNTMGAGWCVRIDGSNVFDSINEHNTKPRRTFQIASGLNSKEQAESVARSWLSAQLETLEQPK